MTTKAFLGSEGASRRMMTSNESRSVQSLSKVARASLAESISSNSLASSIPMLRFSKFSSSLRNGSSLSLLSLVSARTSRAFSWLFQNSGVAARASSSAIFWVKIGRSKIPPEFRQTTFQSAGVDRQEVSDRLSFHRREGYGRPALGSMVLSNERVA